MVAMNREELGSGSFNTTNWSVVLTAGVRGSSEAQAALTVLCGTYWYPLFTFARRCGHEAAQAEDLTQGFFATLMERDFLKDVDRQLGRFRSFLLVAFKHYIANQRRAAHTQKRGGDRRLVSIDLTTPNGAMSRNPFTKRPRSRCSNISGR
jgi:RNA polymerase sigma-70 factor (ECF subfamily)